VTLPITLAKQPLVKLAVVVARKFVDEIDAPRALVPR
jgi:hypothetical protein